jgi:hypothetical protein
VNKLCRSWINSGSGKTCQNSGPLAPVHSTTVSMIFLALFLWSHWKVCLVPEKPSINIAFFKTGFSVVLKLEIGKPKKDWSKNYESPFIHAMCQTYNHLLDAWNAAKLDLDRSKLLVIIFRRPFFVSYRKKWWCNKTCFQDKNHVDIKTKNLSIIRFLFQFFWNRPSLNCAWICSVHSHLVKQIIQWCNLALACLPCPSNNYYGQVEVASWLGKLF